MDGFTGDFYWNETFSENKGRKITAQLLSWG
jgi:hypothetical protein